MCRQQNASIHDERHPSFVIGFKLTTIFPLSRHPSVDGCYLALFLPLSQRRFLNLTRIDRLTNIRITLVNIPTNRLTAPMATCDGGDRHPALS